MRIKPGCVNQRTDYVKVQAELRWEWLLDEVSLKFGVNTHHLSIYLKEKTSAFQRGNTVTESQCTGK